MTINSRSNHPSGCLLQLPLIPTPPSLSASICCFPLSFPMSSLLKHLGWGGRNKEKGKKESTNHFHLAEEDQRFDTKTSQRLQS